MQDALTNKATDLSRLVGEPAEYYHALMALLVEIGKFKLNNKNINIDNINTIIFAQDNAKQNLLFRVFHKAWKDKYTKIEIEDNKDKNTKINVLTTMMANKKANAELDEMTRAAIDAALVDLKLLKKNQENKIILELNNIENYDKAACEIIKNYKTTSQKIIYAISWMFALLNAVGCGITTAVALLMVFGTAWPLVLTSLVLFCFTTRANWKMGLAPTWEAFRDLFGKGGFAKGLIRFYSEDINGLKELSLPKKIALCIAGLFSMGAGFTFGMLTYGFVASIGFMAVALGPMAWLLATVACVVTITMMMKSCVNLIKNENLKESIKEYFKSVFNLNPKLIGEKNTGKRKLTIGIAIGLSIILFPLAIFGLVMTMYTGNVTAMKMIPKLAAYIVCLGVASVAQIPFMVETCTKAIVKISLAFSGFIMAIPGWFKRLPGRIKNFFNAKKQKIAEKNNGENSKNNAQTRVPDINPEKVSVLDAYIIPLGNAIGNGLLAVPDVIAVLFKAFSHIIQRVVGVFAFCGATWNSFASFSINDESDDIDVVNARTRRINSLKKLCVNPQSEKTEIGSSISVLSPKNQLNTSLTIESFNINSGDKLGKLGMFNKNPENNESMMKKILPENRHNDLGKVLLHETQKIQNKVKM